MDYVNINFSSLDSLMFRIIWKYNNEDYLEIKCEKKKLMLSLRQISKQLSLF
jgi:hypothetical protein